MSETFDLTITTDPTIDVTMTTDTIFDLTVNTEPTIDVEMTTDTVFDLLVGTVGKDGVDGPQGPAGADGADGADGAVGGAETHTQASAASTWNITHALTYYPNVSVVDDSTGLQIDTEVDYVNATTIQIRMTSAVSGWAYLS